MNVQCERCKREHHLADALVGGRGTVFRCAECGHHFRVFQKKAEGPSRVRTTARGGDDPSQQYSVVRSDRPLFPFKSFRVVVTAGPDVGKFASSVDGRLEVGVFPGEGATLTLTDPTVSRFHVELEIGPLGVRLRDLKSTNGTLLGAALVSEITLREPAELSVGDSRLRVEPGTAEAETPAPQAASFGALIGSSPAMRAVYAVLQQVAPTSAPVLVTVETGTGKELAARGIHAASERAKGPFEVVDCGGVPAALLESDLFGHERGAFTSAVSMRRGAFERADGGTLFLDEIGELPLEMQPKLLRALGEGEHRRVGGEKTLRTNVRVIAATNRDLRREVNVGRFRADLYYRLAVIHVRMPPLRARLADLAELAPALLGAIARDRAMKVDVRVDAELLGALAQHTWPGNVRELRNHLEQLSILHAAPSFAASGTESSFAGLEGLDQLPLREAKQLLIERFERAYLASLLEQAGGNVAEAARRAGVDRRTLFRTIRRYGLRSSDEA